MRPWSWFKSRLPQGHVEFNVEYDLMQYENKVETIMGIHSWNLLNENNFRSVQKPSQMEHLQIKAK